MRNLTILVDSSHALSLEQLLVEDIPIKTSISSIAFNPSFNRFYVLYEFGLLLCYEDYENFIEQYSTYMKFENLWENWFTIDFVTTTSTIVAISFEGSIAIIEEDLSTGKPKDPDQVGVIDGGIASAKWHPDYSCLMIFTRNNTLLCMSNNWEVINEVEIPGILPLSSVDLSWKGDGDLFAVLSIDDVDKIARIRIYDRELSLAAVGRHVGEGAASVIKGIGSSLVFACNGSYVAYHQVKPGVGHQIGFVEKNGLSHGTFDLRTPSPLMNHQEWTVRSIHSDVTSLLLAVTWSCVSSSNSSATPQIHGCIQIYYRENFYWYLKQQFMNESLSFLQFDPENTMRFFCQERRHTLRIVNLNWMISSSKTRDGTVCMVDGQKLQLTPLGYHSVPPPMSMYQETLESFDTRITTSCPRHVSFWECSKSQQLSGICALLDSSGRIVLAVCNDRGKIVRKSNRIDVLELTRENAEISLLLQSTNFREVFALQAEAQNSLLLLLTGTALYAHPITATIDENVIFSVEHQEFEQRLPKAYDVLISLKLDIPSLKDPVLQYSVRQINVITDIPGAITHLAPIAFSRKEVQSQDQQVDDSLLGSFAFGLSNFETGDFEIIRFTSPLLSQNDAGHVNTLKFKRDTKFKVLTTIPEPCTYFSVIKRLTNEITVKSSVVEAKVDEDFEDDHSRENHGEEEEEHSSDEDYVVVALSTKNRLYCNEILLFTGISSFVYNHSYELMMCMTMGNKPQLHFILLSSLATLLQLSNEDMETNQEKLISLECCEPRPCERGTRLLLSVANDSKVVLQMPRGNLEIIEPRLLLIMKVQRLLLSNQLFEAFLILRKQKIDFNFLFDYSPDLFFQNLEGFIDHCLQLKLTATTAASSSASITTSSAQHQNNFAEYLSLLITSIEPADVTKTKYALFSQSLQSEALLEQKEQFIQKNNFQNENKINFICEKIREILFSKLRLSSMVSSHWINPILCTYAKPKPPLLVEAIEFIKENCIPKVFSATSAETKHYLNNHLLMNSIKYLSFLVEGEKLFQSALSICDFLMAKLIARQCSMDPKVYLPLIESFEIIGKNHPIHSSHYYLMNYHVQIYLKNPQKCIDYFLRLLQTSFQEQYEAAVNGTQFLEVEAVLEQIEGKVVPEVIAIIQKENYFYSHISKLVSIEQEIVLSNKYQTSLKTSLPAYRLFLSYLNKIRFLYANKCSQEMNYSTAIHYYLSTQPPSFVKAIDAALAQSDWMLALTLAGRYSAFNHTADSVDQAYSPLKIAQDLVYNFQQNQEYFSFQNAITTSRSSSSAATAGFTSVEFQHHGDYFANKLLSQTNDGWGKKNINPASSSSQFISGANSLKGTAADTASTNADKSILAAKISLEYCEDVESAVNILTNAYHWMEAIHTAIQYQRTDLLEEVFAAGRVAVKDVMKFLDDKTNRLPAIIEQLNELWKNPIERIQNIAKEDNLLQQALKQEQFQEDDPAEKEEGGGGKGNDETSSEFTAITKYSLQSIRSGRSNKSSKSLVSDSSLISGSHSSVSILSQITDKHRSSSNWKDHESESGEKSFSIQGLDHSLLSRGKVSDDSYTAVSSGKTYYKRDLKPRQQKRVEKQKAKGTYYDRVESDQANNTNSEPSSEEDNPYLRKQKHHQRKKEQQQSIAKDPYETKKEHQLCEDLLQYIHLKPIIQIINELIQLLLLANTNHTTNSNTDRLLLLDVMKSLQQLIELLQKQQLVYAPNYPIVWLLKKNYKSILYYQNYHYYLEKKIIKQLQFIKYYSPQQFQEVFNGNNHNNNNNMNPATMTPEEWNLIYAKSSVLLFNLFPNDEIHDVALLSRNWWQLCLEGIQYYYQQSKVMHLPIIEEEEEVVRGEGK